MIYKQSVSVTPADVIGAVGVVAILGWVLVQLLRKSDGS